MAYVIIIAVLVLALLGAFGGASSGILLVGLVVVIAYGLRRWGRTESEWTTCPHCLNAIRAGATRCQHCHARLSGRDT